MSDHNSESSGGWIFLNDSDEITLEKNGICSLHLDSNYDSVCRIAPESTKASLTNMDFDWKNGQLESDSEFSYDFFETEKLDFAKSYEKFNIDAADIDVDSCTSIDKSEDNIDIHIACVKKVHCYKHNRNDNLNFILSIMVALAVSSALGLGTGHFLGWSHKCWRTIHESSGKTLNYNEPLDTINMQNIEASGTKEKINEIISFTYPENISKVIDFSLNIGNVFVNEKYKKNPNNNHMNDVNDKMSRISDISTFSINQEALYTNEDNQSNISDSKDQSTETKFSQIEWSKLSQTSVSTNEQFSASTKNIIFAKSEQFSIPIKSKNSYLSGDDEMIISDICKDLTLKNKKCDELSYSFKQGKEEDLTKSNNFISELHENLIQVVRTLNIVSLSIISIGDEKFVSIENLRIMVTLYRDLQNTVDSSISFIDEFIQSEGFKMHPKFGSKHLKKMIYTLIDTFDYIIKMSIKLFDKGRKLNVYKFSKNMSKIIFNFDKKWGKNKKHWYETLKRMKIRNSKQKTCDEFETKLLKKGRKHWKINNHHESDFKKKKYKKYSLKF